jgi:hypothetical protein
MILEKFTKWPQNHNLIIGGITLRIVKKVLIPLFIGFLIFYDILLLIRLLTQLLANNL